VPSVKRETVTFSLYAMISAAIISLMAVIMSKTKPIIWLKALWKGLSENSIFGAYESRIVFNDSIKRYVCSEAIVP
jgi:hypothetical protein